MLLPAFPIPSAVRGTAPRQASRLAPVDPSWSLPCSHVLGHVSPIFPPFFAVFCAFSPSRRDGSNEPRSGIQGQETAARGPRPEISALRSTPQILTKGSTGCLDTDERGRGRVHRCTSAIIVGQPSELRSSTSSLTNCSAASAICNASAAIRLVLSNQFLGEGAPAQACRAAEHPTPTRTISCASSACEASPSPPLCGEPHSPSRPAATTQQESKDGACVATVKGRVPGTVKESSATGDTGGRQ